MQSIRVRCAALAASFLAPLVLVAQPSPPACIAGTQQTFAATGAVQTYTVPPGALTILIVADGASGGVSFGGGHGRHIIAGFPATGLTTLQVIAGGVATDNTSGTETSGGGGGSFVYTPPPTTLLVAAGGGGGGDSGSGPFSDGQAGTSGGSNGGLAGAGGTNGGGGGAGGDLNNPNGGGGAGWLGAGGTSAVAGSARGGDQVSPPGDAKGGAAGASLGSSGGFGGGGGQAFFSAGGGGGYSGGGAAGPSAPGGGGGSFVAADGTTYVSSVLPMLGDGSVTICATAIATAAIPSLSPWGLIAMALVLSLAGIALSRMRTAKQRA